MIRAGLLVLGLGLCAACAALPRRVPFRDPLDAREHVRLGTSYEAQGLKREAHAQYEAARRREPGNSEALIALGNEAYSSGDFASAQSFYLRVLRSDPKHAGALNNLAMIELGRGRLKEAEDLAQRALWQNGPLRPFILDTLSSIYARERRFSEAMTAIEQALFSASPEDAALRARLLEARGQLEAAAMGGKALVRP